MYTVGTAIQDNKISPHTEYRIYQYLSFLEKAVIQIPALTFSRTKKIYKNMNFEKTEKR